MYKREAVLLAWPKLETTESSRSRLAERLNV